MKIPAFLEHHGLKQNPFSQEDAQSDPLFKQFCSHETYHPAWDKIFGTPGDPSTAVVFGEKGAGKTALRLQVVDRLGEHNAQNPHERVFVVEYDDFNPFLDCFHQRVPLYARKPERALGYWRLWDHMDAILSISVTQLVDDLLNDHTQGKLGPFEVHSEAVDKLNHGQKRDLLLLDAFYDRSTGMHPTQRWNALRRRLRYWNWFSWREFVGGIVGSLGLFGIMAQQGALPKFGDLWPWLLLLLFWAPWLWKELQSSWLAWWVRRQIRVIDHPLNTLREVLSSFAPGDLTAQPKPNYERSDDRYELLAKLQGVLKTLGFSGMVVIVDRVDEPHLINGSPDRMRDLMWPMFDNKFLKHSGLGFKLLLPIEISFYLNKESSEFYERSRLDKMHMIRSLEWTGESLYDLANDRMKACTNGSTNPPKLKDWFEDQITEAELISTLARLRVPRHLFKFMHRLLVEHCNRYTDDNPKWKIARESLQANLALYLRDLDAYDRGMGTG